MAADQRLAEALTAGLVMAKGLTILAAKTSQLSGCRRADAVCNFGRGGPPLPLTFFVGRDETYRTMKTSVTVLLCSIILAAAAEDQVRLVQHGTNVTDLPSVVLTTNVIKLLQSSRYPSTSYAVKAETWQNLEHSDSFILLTFASPRILKVPLRETGDEGGRISAGIFEDTPIDQILVPLPDSGAGPDHIFVKSGTNVFSFCKWDGSAMMSLYAVIKHSSK
jgi:hypothetical protein